MSPPNPTAIMKMPTANRISLPIFAPRREDRVFLFLGVSLIAFYRRLWHERPKRMDDRKIRRPDGFGSRDAVHENAHISVQPAMVQRRGTRKIH